MNKRKLLSEVQAFIGKKNPKPSDFSFGKPHKNSEILQQILTMSSGTIATLTGYKDYRTIDEIVYDFMMYVDTETIEGKAPSFKSWRDAWAAFKNSKWYEYKYA